MGGLRSAVHWWEESQLRVLVLTSLVIQSSLVIQFLLLIFTFLRRVAIPGWFRFIMWLAYLGGDAVAIYALATLFNRHKAAAGEDGGAGGGSNAMLQVVWAPVLLIHLGGHDGITAYNIEDNELWSPHLLTAVSQVTVAIYVFCKTWPPGGGDKRLLQVAILLFVPGVLKCFQKPWALKSASIYSLVSSPAAVKQKEGGMYPLEDYMKRAKDFLWEQTETEQVEGEVQAARASSSMEHEGRHTSVEEQTEGEAKGARDSSSMEDRINEGMQRWRAATGTGMIFRVRQARALCCLKMADRLQKMNFRIQKVVDWYEAKGPAKRIREKLKGHNETSKPFVDLSSSYSRRLSILEDFCGHTEKRAYGSVRQALAAAFLLLYTKIKTVNMHETGDKDVKSAFSSLIQLVSRTVLPWAAIGLFQHSHREAYNDIDVKITYVLLCCTAALEVYSSGFVIVYLNPSTGLVGEEWPEMVSQYSFIGYFARNMKHSKIMWLISLLGCKHFLNQHWSMDLCFSSARISELVLGYLKDGWKEKIHDATSYRRFNNHHSSEGLSLLSTIRNRPLAFDFDESVLLWHIATDFCFFSTASSSSSGTTNDDGRNNNNCNAAVLCRQMSNYMAYLLFVNPEMLLPGSRRNLFTEAHQDLEHIFEDDNQPLALDNKRELTRKIIRKLHSSSSQEDSGPPETTIIHEAWMLAQRLQNLGDKKWEVIQGVWVEMLCFSASRCRGYLHAKALGSGGEFLSYVWLLLFYMGMETFTDKLKRKEQDDLLPSHDEAATVPPSSYERGSSTTGTAASAHTDAAGASAAPSTSEIRMAQDDMV